MAHIASRLYTVKRLNFLIGLCLLPSNTNTALQLLALTSLVHKHKIMVFTALLGYNMNFSVTLHALAWLLTSNMLIVNGENKMGASLLHLPDANRFPGCGWRPLLGQSGLSPTLAQWTRFLVSSSALGGYAAPLRSYSDEQRKDQIVMVRKRDLRFKLFTLFVVRAASKRC